LRPFFGIFKCPRRNAMFFKSKWAYAALLAVSVALLGLLTSCPKEAAAASDGTITVRVTGADAYNGKYFYYAVGTAGSDLGNPANWIGVAPTSPTIAGGTVECLTEAYGGGGVPATFTGGESYDAAGMIDVDLSGTSTSGDYSFGPDTVLVDGDTMLGLVYPTDFAIVP
jgi:hypothetical protein